MKFTWEKEVLINGGYARPCLGKVFVFFPIMGAWGVMVGDGRRGRLEALAGAQGQTNTSLLPVCSANQQILANDVVVMPSQTNVGKLCARVQGRIKMAGGPYATRCCETPWKANSVTKLHYRLQL